MLPYKLLDWIEPDRIYLWNMCANIHPAATYYIEKLLISDPYHDLDWGLLSANPAAIHILERYPEKIDFSGISMNSAAMHIIKKFPEKIEWGLLNHNDSPEAIKMLKENPEKIDWEYLFQNPTAIDIVLDYINKNAVSRNLWSSLSRNPAAVEYLKLNPDVIDQYSVISNPRVLELADFIKNKEFVFGNEIIEASNPGLIQILRENSKNINTVDYLWLSMNPAIFEYDYIGMRESRKTLHGELMAVCWHPRRVAALLAACGGEAAVVDIDDF
jgi:hypothetical protein